MSNNPSSDPVTEQAAAWAKRFEDDEPVTKQEREEFRAWVSNPAHQEAFLAQVAIAELASEVDLRAHVPVVRVIAADTTAASVQTAPTTRTPTGLRYAAAAAAALFIIAGVSWIFTSPQSRSTSFTTSTREVRTVDFQDGSTATMNTRSELSWVGSSQDRRVVLKRGEALFRVVHDVERPFRVLVGDLDEIRVVGTQFNVYRKSEGTIVVSVLEGQVEVIHRDSDARVIWSRHVSADQQLQYRNTGLPALRGTGASRAVRWTEGELDVEETPLAEVVAELGRYTDERIELVPDSRLARTYVGGVLSVNDIDGALTLLQKRVPIQVTQNPETGAYKLSYRYEHSPEPPTDETPNH